MTTRALQVRLLDDLGRLGLYLERAEYTHQDIREDYFHEDKPKTERGQFFIIHEHDRARVKADIVQDYLYEMRKQLREISTFVEHDGDSGGRKKGRRRSKHCDGFIASNTPSGRA